MTLKTFATKVMYKRHDFVFLHIGVDSCLLEITDGTKVAFTLCNDNVFVTINGFETGKPKVNIRNPLSVNKCVAYFEKELIKVRNNRPPYNVKKGD